MDNFYCCVYFCQFVIYRCLHIQKGLRWRLYYFALQFICSLHLLLESALEGRDYTIESTLKGILSTPSPARSPIIIIGIFIPCKINFFALSTSCWKLLCSDENVLSRVLSRVSWVPLPSLDPPSFSVLSFLLLGQFAFVWWVYLWPWKAPHQMRGDYPTRFLVELSQTE